MGMTTAGTNLMASLIAGAGGSYYDATNAYVTPGTDTTAFALGNTTLTGAVTRKLVNAVPTATALVMVHRSLYLGNEATVFWREIGVFNAVTGGTLLIRVSATSGGWTADDKTNLIPTQTWQITLTTTLSLDAPAGNNITTAGLGSIAGLLVNNGVFPIYNSTNAYLQIGTSSTAFDVAQTVLVTPVAPRVLVDAAPTLPSANTTRWRTVFQDGVGNGIWNEAGVFNGLTGNTMLIRTVGSISGGASKGAGDIWSLQIDVTFTSTSTT